MPRPGPTLARRLLPLLCTLAAGCAESSWIIPYPRTQTPSKLWTTDPRTRGWDGVEARYILFGDGHVDADIRSFDGHHHLKARGESWYENEQGQRFTAYRGSDVSPVWVVRFDGREERYVAGNVSTGRGRALKPFTPPTTPPTRPAAD
jgi:hypothetical protein